MHELKKFVAASQEMGRWAINRKLTNGIFQDGLSVRVPDGATGSGTLASGPFLPWWLQQYPLPRAHARQQSC